MGWKGFWLFMRKWFERKPQTDPAEILLEQLRAERALRTELLRQLAEKDAQIRMVLEDRFYRPVVTEAGEKPVPRAPLFDPEILNDVAQFDEAADAMAIAAQEKGPMIQLTAEELRRWKAEHLQEAKG